MDHQHRTMPFGKHRGELLDDIPTQYLQWVHDECDDLRRWPWLKPAVQRILNGDGGELFPANGHRTTPQRKGHRTEGQNSAQQEHIDFTTSMMKKGKWFPLPFDFFMEMELSPSEALLLGRLLNRGRILADEGGWIPAGSKFLSEALRLDPADQVEALAGLKRRGLVKIKKDGTGRRVRVQLDELDRQSS